MNQHLSQNDGGNYTQITPSEDLYSNFFEKNFPNSLCKNTKEL